MFHYLSYYFIIFLHLSVSALMIDSKALNAALELLSFTLSETSPALVVQMTTRCY
jgi:hypothetical protein